MATSDRHIGIALILTSAVAFAIGPTAAKLALENGSNTLTVVTLRGAIGAALLALLVVAFRQQFRIGRKALRWSLLCTGFNALMVYGLIGALSYIPVSVAILIFFTHPIIIAAFVHLRGSDRLSARKLFLAVTVFAGLVLALAPTFDTLETTGIALAALSAVTIAGAILSGARAQQYATSTQVNLYVTAITAVIFAIITSGLEDWSFPVNAIGWIGVTGAGFGIAVGLLTFFAAIRYLSALRATIMSNVEPLLSILFASVILGERLQAQQWIGAAVMIGAIVLFELSGQAEPAQQTPTGKSDPE
jgi:drug/metabolite transporter (DMT)-like permease